MTRPTVRHARHTYRSRPVMLLIEKQMKARVGGSNPEIWRLNIWRPGAGRFIRGGGGGQRPPCCPPPLLPISPPHLSQLISGPPSPTHTHTLPASVQYIQGEYTYLMPVEIIQINIFVCFFQVWGGLQWTLPPLQSFWGKFKKGQKVT